MTFLSVTIYTNVCKTLKLCYNINFNCFQYTLPKTDVYSKNTYF